jgi:NADPH2:quinone reductase
MWGEVLRGMVAGAAGAHGAEYREGPRQLEDDLPRPASTVIGTVRRTADLDRVDRSAVVHAVALDAPDAVEQIRAQAPDGVDRVVEVSLSDNADLDVQVLAVGGVIGAHVSRDDRPGLPFWPLLFANVTLRLLGSDDFPAAAKQQAAADLSAAAGGRVDLDAVEGDQAAAGNR